MKCPKCKKGILYKAFTLEGDIGWCLKCDYRTSPDTSWKPKIKSIRYRGSDDDNRNL